MDGSTTLTVRLPAKIKKQLGRLAEATDRTKSWHAAQAIKNYVAHENAIADDIREGLAELRSGKIKFTPHKEAMARLRATIEKAARVKR